MECNIIGIIICSFIMLTILLNSKYRSVHKNIQKVTNQIVIVTGCDSGIGLEVAKRVIDWGYHLVACCYHLESYGASQLKNKNADLVNLDVTNERSVKSLFEKLYKLQNESKEIYCLVNNAGMMTYALTEWHTWDLVEKEILTNLSGTIQLSRMILPLLRKTEGRIVNVSSPQGLIASPYMTPYCASKWGIESFSQALRREVNPYGVKVVIVRPCNLPHKTSILKQNGKYLTSMWNEMNPETKEHFSQEYEAMKEKFDKAFSNINEPESIDEEPLIEAFKCAITSPSPQYSYTAAPFIVRLFFYIVKLLPVTWVDSLIKLDIHNKVLSKAKSD